MSGGNVEKTLLLLGERQRLQNAFQLLVGRVKKDSLLRGSHTFSYEPERPAEGILGRLFYSITKTKTADGFLHFLQSRVKNAVIIAKVL